MQNKLHADGFDDLKKILRNDLESSKEKHLKQTKNLLKSWLLLIKAN